MTIPIANMFTKIDAYDISPTHLTSAEAYTLRLPASATLNSAQYPHRRQSHWKNVISFTRGSFFSTTLHPSFENSSPRASDVYARGESKCSD